MIWIIPLVFLIIFEMVADIFSKEYSLQDKWYFYVGAILAYVIGNMFWLSAIKNGSGLAKGSLIFAIASAIFSIIIGVVFYKEGVGKLQIVGMVVGIFALVLIFWE